VLVAVDGHAAGVIALADALRETSPARVPQLSADVTVQVLACVS
jgi:cation transport ATPase